MNHVVFVRPPNLQKGGDWKKQGVTRCPLNIALLASYIREKGNYTCAIADFEIIPENNPKNMAQIILKDNPKYVCFTTLTPRFPIVTKIAKDIKEIDPSVIVIIGGPHFTGNPKTSLYEGITYGIIGEGEEALLELLNALDKGKDISNIQNLVYRKDNEVIVNPPRPYIKDLDSLPLAAWDLMKIDEYIDSNYFEGPHLCVFTTRGCPYNCKFCASHVTWNRKVRFNSVDRVIKELKYIVNVLGVKNIMFHDDNFTSNRKWANELCDRLLKEKLDIKYSIQIRADNVNKELLIKLKDSGCMFVSLGIESGNEEILKTIGKNENKTQYKNAVSLIKSVGIPITASYILGFPEDTHETIQETIDFAFELDATHSKFMILSTYPGTRYYDIAKERGIIRELSLEQMENLNFYDSVSINLSNVSNEDLIKYQDQAFNRYDKIVEERKLHAEN